MNLDDVANALAEKLDTIAGMRAHSEVPTKIAPPAAIVGLGSGAWETLDDLMSVDFGVLLLLSVSNNRGAQQTLRDFCGTTSALSIKNALEQDGSSLLLAGTSTGCTVRCESFDPPAIVELGGTEYLGVEFHLSVVE